MNIQQVKRRLEAQGILYSEQLMQGRPTVIGYDKRFRWKWFTTQLNTFVVAIDFGRDAVTLASIEAVLTEAFAYAHLHNKGWPRGLQSGIGVISILLSSNVDPEAIRYCRELKSSKRWAGFAIPVVVDTLSGKVHAFERRPLWGWIYYPHFKKLIDEVLQ